MKKCLSGKLLPFGKLFLIFILLSPLLKTKAAVVRRSLYFSSQDTFPPGISIGQQVPDHVIGNILNYKTNSAKLSDFKGKLLILDFWATWCAPCVALIPRMDSLQRIFTGKIQFLPVTYQSRPEVESFLARLGKYSGRNYSLPDVVEDQVLQQMFPHRELPHFVWIDASGVVKAITGYEEITGNNIRKILNEDSPLPEKSDKVIPYDDHIPLLVSGNGGSGENMLYHSFLSGQTPGLPASFRYEPFTGDSLKPRKVTVLNVPLKTLYSIAYGADTQHLADNRIIYETADTLELINHSTGKAYNEWAKDHTYCYELAVPPFMSRDLFHFMREDLRHLFTAFDAVLEKRKVKCLVLVRTTAEDKLKTSGGERMIAASGLNFDMVDHYLTDFFARLDHIYLQRSRLPVIDGTGYRNRADLHLEADLSNVSSLNSALEAYGLKFIEAERELEMLVIRDAHSVVPSRTSIN